MANPSAVIVRVRLDVWMFASGLCSCSCAFVVFNHGMDVCARVWIWNRHLHLCLFQQRVILFACLCRCILVGVVVLTYRVYMSPRKGPEETKLCIVPNSASRPFRGPCKDQGQTKIRAKRFRRRNMERLLTCCLQNMRAQTHTHTHTPDTMRSKPRQSPYKR